MRAEAPALVRLLERAFGDGCIDLFSADYERARGAGGNAERDGTGREEGVSFRPRIARILSILLKEVQGVQLQTARAAVYAAGQVAPPVEVAHEALGAFLSNRDVGSASLPRCPESCAVALAVELDAVRHLHMTQLDHEARTQQLSAAEKLASASSGIVPLDTLRQKLLHAIKLQRRNLGVGETVIKRRDESER